MKLTAEIIADELIEKDEETQESTLKFECEGLDEDDLILIAGDRKFKMNATDLMEAVARVALQMPTIVKSKEDD